MNVFEKSLFIRAGSVLGHRLKPFSAFHSICLNMFESPFLTGGEPNRGDIATAILICTSDSSTGLDKVLRFQNSRISRWVWTLRLYLSNPEKVISALSSHISNYFDYPQVGVEIGPDKKTAIRKTGAPWQYFMVSVMWQQTGARLKDIWDMPLCELACHKAIHDEMNGLIEIADGLLEERERNRKKNAHGQD